MKKRILLTLAVLAAAALPASANASGFTFAGVVVAKEAKRGTVVVATRSGSAVTLHTTLSATKLGDRVVVAATKLRDGTLRSTGVHVTGHASRATVRGVVVRRLSTRTLLSTGRSVIAIQRHSALRALASRGLTPGSVARFDVTINGGVVRELSAAALGTTNTVRVEGKVVTLSPFVVDVEGLPITIGLGTAILPVTLKAGDEVELTVTVDANNVFTLVSVDEVQGAEQGDEQGDDHSTASPTQGQEVEVEGTDESSGSSGDDGGSDDSGGSDG